MLASEVTGSATVQHNCTGFFAVVVFTNNTCVTLSAILNNQTAVITVAGFTRIHIPRPQNN